MDNKGLIAGIVGMFLIIIGGLGFLAHETATGPSRSDCMAECRVDGWQYRPLVYSGECWCDALEGRPLTAEGE